MLTRFYSMLLAGGFARLFLLVLPAQIALGQHQDFSEASVRAYRQVLNLELSGAEKTLAHSRTDALSLYSQHLVRFLELMLQEDRDVYDRYAAERENLLKQARETLDDEDPYYRFLTAEIYFQSSAIKIKYDSYLGAALDFRRSFRLIRRNYELFPDFTPNYKTLGAINSLINAVPPQFRWILSLVGISEHELGGLELLDRVPYAGLFRFEADMLIVLINIYLRQEFQDNLPLLASMEAEWSGSYLYRFVYGVALMKARQSEEALAWLSPLSDSPAPIDYTHYLLGEIFLHKGAYGKAIAHYNLFTQTYKGTTYLKDALYKQGLCHYLIGAHDAARTAFETARKAPASKSDADRYAQRQLEKEEWPDKLILQLRFFTDGGYFDQADSLLRMNRTVSFETADDKAEWVYRKARLRHLRGNEKESIPLYKSVLDDFPELNENYIQPNSALQLGYIYKERGNSEIAAGYFNRAMQFTGYPYKNGIDSKAKAALEEMK